MNSLNVIEINAAEAHNLVTQGLSELCSHDVIGRIWNHDHTVWKPVPTEIVNRLGWLTVMRHMTGEVGRMKRFKQELLDDGFTHVLLLGMGGSSLAPELFQKTFAESALADMRERRALHLKVVDTTDADAIRAIAEAHDLARTCMIVSTKSGGTVETLSAFKYFYNQTLALVGPERVGQHFAGITDPGSKIVELGRRFRFRHVFENDPNIGGRYSALSYFGLVPATLVGVDVIKLLERAIEMSQNAMTGACDTIGNNHAAVLGTLIGKLALQSHDKLTFLAVPELASFGDWAEQLIAESLGKEGKGVLPVVGEPIAPIETYGPDRLFVHLRLHGHATFDDLTEALVKTGHPVATIRLDDLYDIGGQFLLWEMATAIAGHILGINPFDQPNVEAAKVRAREIVAAYMASGSLPGGQTAEASPQVLAEFLQPAGPGDYVAIHGYVPPTSETEVATQALRQAIHLRTGLATTFGYGPRFLHSTGQLHKGDGGNGFFIQLVSKANEDVPIPDEAGSEASTMGFDVLKRAQALGDSLALKEVSRRVITFDIGTDVAGTIEALAAKI